MQYSSQSPSSSPLFNGPLVQPADVLTALNIPSQGGGRIKLVDGSWHLPKPGAPNRDPLVEFNAQHCSGAVFFDIDAVADGSSDLPHMLPSAELFSEACRSLGITQDDTVVVYGCQGSLSAPRVWWTFRAFGHHKVIDLLMLLLLQSTVRTDFLTLISLSRCRDTAALFLKAASQSSWD
jgi:3-mercaptopyruvate sulfurtransferase SseA